MLGLSYFTVATEAARIVASLNANDFEGAVTILGPYSPDERVEILGAASAAGADETSIMALTQMLGSGEVIVVEGKAPTRQLDYLKLALSAVGGVVLGMIMKGKA